MIARPSDEPLPTERIDTAAGAVSMARYNLQPDKPPFVFVHGYPDNLQIWSRVVRHLAPDHGVVAFDWPGLGHSEPVVGGGTPFHLGRHLITVLDALDIERAIPVGFDMGAHAVVAAAAADRHRFPGVILTNFLADGTAATSWDIAVMRKLGLNRRVLRHAPRLVFGRAQHTFLEHRRSLSKPIRAEMWRGFHRPETRDHLRKMGAGYEAALPRIVKLYSHLDMPVLVLWADSDPHFPLAQAHALMGRLPNCELVLLEGASHWFMWDRSDDVAEALGALTW